MRCLAVVATLLLIASCSTPALAQTGTWTSHGPEGGSISALTVDPRSPTTLYAGSLGAGVFKSTEAADSWIGLGPAMGINAIEIRWPSGQKQTVTRPEIDRYLTIREPQ